MEPIFSINVIALVDFELKAKAEDYTAVRAQHEICELHQILEELKIEKITREEAIERYQKISWYPATTKVTQEDYNKHLNK